MMLRQRAYKCMGISGRYYSFTLYGKSEELPISGGLYVLAYSHPRGHLAGFQIDVLRVGITGNLRAAVGMLADDMELRRDCWNSTCIAVFADAEQRRACYDDLPAAVDCCMLPDTTTC